MEPMPLVLAILPYTVLATIFLTLTILGVQKIGWIPALGSLTKKQVRLACGLLVTPIVVVYALFFIPTEWIMLFGYYESWLEAMYFKFEVMQLAYIISGSAVLTFSLFKLYYDGEKYLTLLVLVIITLDFTLVTTAGLENYLLLALFESHLLEFPTFVIGFSVVAWYFGWSSVTQEKAEHINPYLAERMLHGLMRRFLYDKSQEAYAAIRALSDVRGESQKILIEKAKDLRVVLDDFQSDNVEQVHTKYVELVKERYYPLSVKGDSFDLGKRYLLTDKDYQRKKLLLMVGVIVSVLLIISFLLPVFNSYFIDMTSPIVILTFASNFGIFIVFQSAGLTILLFVAYDGKLSSRMTEQEIVEAVLEIIPDYQ
ncbi:MAG: hypothetical protein RTU30_12595 [Candidatus Thorarchaeota archaeon]